MDEVRAGDIGEERSGRSRRGLLIVGSIAVGLVLVALAVGVGVYDDTTPSLRDDGPRTLQRSGGETQQGRRIVLEPADGRQISIRLSMVCGQGDRAADVWYEERTFPAEVSDDGSFAFEQSFVEEGTDGDESRISVWIDGDIDRDDRAEGTVRAVDRRYNGQSRAVDSTCDTGRVGWSASPVPAPPVVTSTAVDQVVALQSSEEGAWAFTRDARVVRIGEDDPDVPASTSADPIFDAHAWRQDASVVGGAVWSHIDSGELSGTIARTELGSGDYTWVPKAVVDLAAGNDSLWALTAQDGAGSSRLERLDPQTGAELASAPSIHGRIAVGSDAVWVVADPLEPGARSDTVQGHDPDTLEVIDRFSLETEEVAHQVGWSPAGLWLTLEEGLLHVDTGTGTETPFAFEPGAVAADETGAWVASAREQAVRRIEGGEVVRVIDLDMPPNALATSADGTLWVASAEAGTVQQLRP